MHNRLAISAIIAFFVLSGPFSSADAQTPPSSEVLAAAKKEGKVVIVGSPDPVMRNEVIPKFKARFGISVEYIAGRDSQTVTRIQTERLAGIYSVDVFMTGPNTAMTMLHPQKMVDPLKLDPDVAKGSNWKGGKPRFIDRDGQYLLGVFGTVDTLAFINTDYVKPEELRSAQDLLNPKWKGKIQAEDPTSIGSGAGTAAHYLTQLGPEFFKKLYIDQKPEISRDGRQMNDWLARGTYPICLTCRGDDVIALQKEGFHLEPIFEFSDMSNRVKLSPFVLSLANKAPNPNAAHVFINWMAGKEALEIYSRQYGVATLRADADESFLDPRVTPRPDKKYFDDTDSDWMMTGRVEAGNKVKELLKGY